MFRDAHISDCGVYRYSLVREWNAELPKLYVNMLNPSTADGLVDDNTIRKLIGFAKAYGYGGLIVVNLFALRATDPDELFAHRDPVGPENDRILELVARREKLIVCAWGAHAAATQRAKHVEAIFRRHSTALQCFGTNQNGSPKHPLYLASETRLVSYSPKGITSCN